MTSSSNLTRPLSSFSRPSSSASHRPSNIQRPPSSLGRPISSLSIRPGSRVSQRPNSRHSRPPTRQSSRLLPLCQALVTQVIGSTAEHDAERFRTAVEFVSKSLEHTTKAAVSVDLTVTDRQIGGHAHKARINSRDELGQALEISYQKLKTEVQQHTDLDQEIKMSYLPDHLQFLIMLSLPPTQSTLDFAETYLEKLRNPPQPSPTLTWKDILDEEPFEGQHWEGVYGLPPGSTVEIWDSGGSTPSPSPLDDSDDLEGSSPTPASAKLLDDIDETVATVASKQNSVIFCNGPRTYGHRKEFEDFQARQYWRADWRTDTNLNRSFDIGEASTLGPSFQRILARSSNIFSDSPEQEKYIDEEDAVREVLMALQGRNNILLTWNPIMGDQSAFVIVPNAPRLMHLTMNAQASILSSFAQTATSVEHLRKFVSSIFTKASQSFDKASKPPHLVNVYSGNTRTLEAFSDAVDQEIRAFNQWCADKEAEICRAHGGVGPFVIVSLLSLEKAIQDRFSQSFNVCLDIFQKVMNCILPSQQTPAAEQQQKTTIPVPPAAVTADLLDILIQAVQDRLSIGDNVTSDVLIRVFSKTAEPVWAMVGRWLKNGMPVRDQAGRCESYGDTSLDDEFFIEDNEMLLMDPDFWKEGYTLRDGAEEGTGPRAVPVFLAHVVEHILGSGKSVGLLRALGVSLFLDGDHVWLSNWQSFSALLTKESCREQQQHPTGSSSQQDKLFSVSTDALSQVVYDVLLPCCQSTGARLAKALVDDFDVQKHLSTIEDIYLMRKGDAMSHFADALFAKMDCNQSWSDFHFLNTAFSDVVDAASIQWVKTSQVRLSYRGSKDKVVNRTVKAIDGLLLEYAVPFPLAYIFSPHILQVYGSIFVFLLQIRRSKSVLERILVRGFTISNLPHSDGELKAFYAMRSKLSWFINVLLNFLTTYVIHAEVHKFQFTFRAARSLDEMIQLHDDHLAKIQSHCLLTPTMSALHGAVISILDMCLDFADFFVAFAGDSTLDISRRSVTMKRHRSRRRKRQQRDIIGFSQSLRAPQDSSDDDSDFDAGDNMIVPEPSFSMAILSVSSAEEDFASRLDRMSLELDGLVRFIRRGVESFAGGAGDTAPAFGILAFALEDWDT